MLLGTYSRLQNTTHQDTTIRRHWPSAVVDNEVDGRVIRSWPVAQKMGRHSSQRCISMEMLRHLIRHVAAHGHSSTRTQVRATVRHAVRGCCAQWHAQPRSAKNDLQRCRFDSSLLLTGGVSEMCCLAVQSGSAPARPNPRSNSRCIEHRARLHAPRSRDLRDTSFEAPKTRCQGCHWSVCEVNERKPCFSPAHAHSCYRRCR